MRLPEVLEEYLSVSLGRTAYAIPLGAFAASLAGVFWLNAVVSQLISPPLGALPTEVLIASLTTSHLILGLVSLSLARILAGELRSEVAFHLSLPIRREEYAAAWLAAVVWIPVALELISPLVPIAIMDPRLMTGVVVWPLVYRAVEDALVFCTILWEALRGRSGLVTVYGIVAILLLPLLAGLVLALTGASASRHTVLVRVLGDVLPATTSLLGAWAPRPWWEPILVSGSLAAVLQAGFVAWVGRRLEVK